MDHHPQAVDAPSDEHDIPMPATLKAGASYPPTVALTMQFWTAAPATTLHQHQHSAVPFWSPAMATYTHTWCWNELAVVARQFDLPAETVSVAHGEGSPHTLGMAWIFVAAVAWCATL